MKNRPLRKDLVSGKTAESDKLVEQVHQFKYVEKSRSPQRKRYIENKKDTCIHTSGIKCIILVEPRYEVNIPTASYAV
jgi:hypothetical protein